MAGAAVGKLGMVGNERVNKLRQKVLCPPEVCIVDGNTLRDAQRHPEKYRDLLVRVATYSAYFVELSKELQDDIIARTEFQEA